MITGEGMDTLRAEIKPHQIQRRNASTANNGLRGCICKAPKKSHLSKAAKPRVSPHPGQGISVACLKKQIECSVLSLGSQRDRIRDAMRNRNPPKIHNLADLSILSIDIRVAPGQPKLLGKRALRRKLPRGEPGPARSRR